MGAIILFLLIYTFTQPTTQDLSKYDKQKTEIDSLSNNIKVLQKEQIKLNKSLLTHQNKIDSLNYQIDSTNQELTSTRNYYGKKIRDINNYTPTQLDDFFSKRY
jgi:peptidoglycan hydrolase CwlO-like protein